MADRPRALVLVAHPCPDSFTHASAGAAVAGLRRSGRDVNVVDLYASGFRAAMSLEERRAYHGPDPIVDPQVAEQARLVKEAESIVFVYPTWWSGQPAILKGWLDRVMVPDVGFRFDERTGNVRPGLTNVRHIVGISSAGSSRLVVGLINDNGRRTLTRTLRMACGWRTRVRWYGMYAMDRAADEKRRRFLDRVERGLARL